VKVNVIGPAGLSSITNFHLSFSSFSLRLHSSLEEKEGMEGPLDTKKEEPAGLQASTIKVGRFFSF